MVKKQIAVCGKCLCRLGVTFDRSDIPKMFCAACEPFVTHQEELKEQWRAEYKNAANALSTP